MTHRDEILERALRRKRRDAMTKAQRRAEDLAKCKVILSKTPHDHDRSPRGRPLARLFRALNG